MHICVIDDDDIYQFLLRKELKHTNMVESIHVFTNGKQAIAFFQDNSGNSSTLPDVIFLDINMPIMNGWQFLDEFQKIKHKIDKKITIYMVSSSFDNRDVVKSKEYAEVTDYIIKPVKRSNLISVLENVGKGNS